MRKLLIANRGEIARRVIRTAHAMGISTVAVYSDVDRDALHMQEAGASVALGGSASADSYLSIEKLLAAARDSGADAVHPGYGFLSESAEFAQAVIDAGLIWVGPPPDAIRALGSKSAAKQLALAHGVPCLPGYHGAAQDEDTLQGEAQRIGLPLMVKAVAGGGGRGMRLVTDWAQLLPALKSARSEALAGFGSGDLLLERALLNPRHVEVQVFADAQGHCIHLGERDCSVQRRHQKIIEESPSPAVSPALRAKLGRCAVALAQAAGYVGAGTVEFLLDGEQFWLMEMNTRLQVEHPVTEMLTGLDLVEWQLRVARGEPLPLTQEQVKLNGHAIEVRLCAEDEQFMPHTGKVLRFEPPELSDGLRFDHALANGLDVSPHYDAMLGKLIAHAATRDEAIDRLTCALDRTAVIGLPTNRAFLAACLRDPVFRAGEATIPFLQQNADGVRQRLRLASAQQQVAVALAVCFARVESMSALACPHARPVRLRLGGNAMFTASLQEQGGGVVRVRHEEREYLGRLVGRPAARRRIEVDGLGFAVTAERVSGVRWQVQIDGHEVWVDDLSHEPVRQAGAGQGALELRAPFNGKLLAVHAAAGQRVERGESLLVVESMKIEHQLAAPRDAVVSEVVVAPGSQVTPGQLLLRFAAGEPA